MDYKFGLFLLLSTGFILANGSPDVFFPITRLKIAIPQTTTTANLLSKIPFAKFNVISMSLNIDPTDFVYKLENTDDFLQINSKSGDLFLGQEYPKLKKPKQFVLSAHNSRTATETPHMTIDIKPTTEKDFCANLENLCFWETASYSLIENRKADLFESYKIGDIGPQAFNYICQQYDISYIFTQESKYVRIEDGAFFTKSIVDFEMDPVISLGIQCSVRSTPNSVPRQFQRTINMTVLDRNDNGPRLQKDKDWNFVLDSPQFKQNTSIVDKITFVDADSLQANSNFEYKIRNDTFNILRPICHAFETGQKGAKNSIITCQVIFSQSGSLSKSPYCAFLEVEDLSVDSDAANSARAKICIRSEHRKSDFNRPTTMALRTSHKLKLLEDETLLNAFQEVPISYPKNVFVYRQATNFSRVTQPERMLDLIGYKDVKFFIVEDRSRAFGITADAGIVYVRNNVAMQSAPEAIYFLSINSTDKYNSTFTINVHLQYGRPANTTCEQKDKRHRSCSLAETKKQCEKLCGVGTGGGSCQWRGANTVHFGTNYASCVPDKQFCPDNRCDPLESIDKLHCPQDCASRTKIVGYYSSNEEKRGILAAAGTCSCDDSKICSCGYVEEVVASKPRRNGRKNEVDSTAEPFPIKSDSAIVCGPSCLTFALACPTFLVIIVICLLFSRRKYRRQAKETTSALNEKLQEVSKQPEIMSVVASDMETCFKIDSTSMRWEFPREQLVLDEVLGEGEFGKVVQGFATDISGVAGVTTVAVKMIRAGANAVEQLALFSEFQLLQEVSHPNVIRLLGACTKGESPLVIIEYAKFGSLRNYLRLSRKIETCGAEFESDGVAAVQAKDILSFAWQICKGMAYLSEIKLVHRDLAARNVLLAEGKICKISDFGLTRDVYEENAYLKRSSDRVPVKWMAPESLADHVYTTKSDVWAFGVLAWELITLGASPYPGIAPHNLYDLLKTGHRMGRPGNCSEEIYSIIRSCWVNDPMSRPSFKYLASKWEALLGSNIKDIENAISNPLYCKDEEEETDTFIDDLWKTPKMIYDSENSSRGGEYPPPLEYNLIIPPGYDLPRLVFDPKVTEPTIRYENDFRFPLSTRRTSTPVHNSNHYTLPVKRGRSHMDMSINQANENIDYDDIKKFSKQITFRFSSLLNISDQQET